MHSLHYTPETLRQRMDNRIASESNRRRLHDIYGPNRVELERGDPQEPGVALELQFMIAKSCVDYTLPFQTEPVYEFKHPNGRYIQVRNRASEDPLVDPHGPDASPAAIYNVTDDERIFKPYRMPIGSYRLLSHVFVDPNRHKVQVQRRLDSVYVLGRKATDAMVRPATQTEVLEAISVLRTAKRDTVQQHGRSLPGLGFQNF